MDCEEDSKHEDYEPVTKQKARAKQTVGRQNSAGGGEMVIYDKVDFKTKVRLSYNLHMTAGH
jgi:hypothetical protein